MSLMEQFANPETMHALSVSDKMAGAGITTLMGMGITFTILLLLWGCIAMMNKLSKIGEKRTKRKEQTKKSAVPTAAPAAAPTVAAAAVAEAPAPAGKVEPEGTLAAVLSAAIAAYEEGNGAQAPGLVVRKIRRVSGSSPIWASAGRGESVDSRRV